MMNARAAGVLAVLTVGWLSKAAGCSEAPEAAVLQRCIQEHLEREPASRIGFNHPTAMLPQIIKVQEVGTRVECEATAPVISKTFLDTESTKTMSFRVHLRKTETGYACAGVEEP